MLFVFVLDAVFLLTVDINVNGSFFLLVVEETNDGANGVPERHADQVN